MVITMADQANGSSPFSTRLNGVKVVLALYQQAQMALDDVAVGFLSRIQALAIIKQLGE